MPNQQQAEQLRMTQIALLQEQAIYQQNPFLQQSAANSWNVLGQSMRNFADSAPIRTDLMADFRAYMYECELSIGK
jgi:hypothetical protein